MTAFRSATKVGSTEEVANRRARGRAMILVLNIILGVLEHLSDFIRNTDSKISQNSQGWNEPSCTLQFLECSVSIGTMRIDWSSK